MQQQANKGAGSDTLIGMTTKPTRPSGFPENLPGVQAAEDALKDAFRTQAELYGFVPIETPAVEYLSTFEQKGEIEQQIFTIGRALAEGEHDPNPRALRFDLTVPLARYVAEHYNDLSFPFKRYQVQKVWRGERSKKARFREFYQADVDVIANGSLPITADAECIEVAMHALSAMVPNVHFTVRINHRGVLNALLVGLGVQDIANAIAKIDAVSKVGIDATVDTLLETESSLQRERTREFIESICSDVSPGEIRSWERRGDIKTEEGQAALKEVEEVFALLEGKIPSNVTLKFSPSIARGLDYYTGHVFETTIDGLEAYGSVCSGGRYDDLASKFISRKLPGFGASIGLSRLMATLLTENLIVIPKGVARVFVGYASEEQARDARALAASARGKSLTTEVSLSAKHSFAEQAELAEKRGAELFLFLRADSRVVARKRGLPEESFESAEQAQALFATL